MDSQQPCAEQRPPPKLSKANAGWGNLRPARKGEPSRNIRGRPKKDYDIAAMAQAHAQLAIDTLVAVMKDPGASASARVSAASEVLDRGVGRAPQSLAVAHEATFSAELEDFIQSLSAGRHNG